LGRRFCLALVQEGDRVMVADIADFKETIREIEAAGGVAKRLRTNVSSPKDTRRMAEETVTAFGRIDILVH
jgi:3-oxoacyl-[acyl-carrier protein] reductase